MVWEYCLDNAVDVVNSIISLQLSSFFLFDSNQMDCHDNVISAANICIIE